MHWGSIYMDAQIKCVILDYNILLRTTQNVTITVIIKSHIGREKLISQCTMK